MIFSGGNVLYCSKSDLLKFPFNNMAGYISFFILCFLFLPHSQASACNQYTPARQVKNIILLQQLKTGKFYTTNINKKSKPRQFTKSLFRLLLTTCFQTPDAELVPETGVDDEQKKVEYIFQSKEDKHTISSSLFAVWRNNIISPTLCPYLNKLTPPPNV
jgi:hypothetical protein